jgi:hypothetical protein
MQTDPNLPSSPCNHNPESPALELVSYMVRDLLLDMADKNVCPQCTAVAVLSQAIDLNEHMIGRAGMIEILEAILGRLCAAGREAS